MSENFRMALAGVSLLVLTSLSAFASDVDVLSQRVADTERAFAATMADRDFDAFQSFLADETVFFAGEEPIRGKQAVAGAWAGFYEGEQAPFSWEPETVVVLDSGTLALSSGPVRTPDGQRVATFQSIWRLEADGEWRIVFDKGSSYCPPPEPPSQD